MSRRLPSPFPLRTSSSSSSPPVVALPRSPYSLSSEQLADAPSPAKSLPMQAIMLYFSGSGVQIFSLGMIFMLVTGPIQAIAGILRGESASASVTSCEPTFGHGRAEHALALQPASPAPCSALVLIRWTSLRSLTSRR